MLIFVRSVLVLGSLCLKSISGQRIVGGGGSEHLWANLHKTNMAADNTCVPYSRARVLDERGRCYTGLKPTIMLFG